MKVIYNGLYQEKLVQDKWTILCPKMAHPENSGSALRILFQFCRMKGSNRYMKILLLFEKKIHLGQFELFSLEVEIVEMVESEMVEI